ncbi:hypothetical protein, partial [Nocardioides malaquae]|uniref:hypothetical protein n=1 Tax=Nocardioides malaquae TaxID=2773426 RepID=UPI001D0D5388
SWSFGLALQRAEDLKPVVDCLSPLGPPTWFAAGCGFLKKKKKKKKNGKVVKSGRSHVVPWAKELDSVGVFLSAPGPCC